MTVPNEPLVRSLQDGHAYPHATHDIQVIETHISWLLLTGEYAYKVKKAIELPFLDFSSLEQRKHFCAEELRLNTRLAPGVYVDVVPISGTADRPRVGTRPAIDYAVKMKQFPNDATLDQQLAADRVSIGQVRDLAVDIGRFHLGLAPTRRSPGTPVSLQNLTELEDCLDSTRRRKLLAIAAWIRTTRAQIATMLDRHRSANSVKECHGDLHLENLAVIDNRIVAFDALEFSEELRTVDVIDEAAFTTMDFMASGRADCAFAFLTAYLECTGDYGGLTVLRHFLCKRALIRAKVHAIAARQGADAAWQRCDDYLDLAAALRARKAPLLVVTRGLSGSGKTTVSGALVTGLGAVRVRSDLERKRLHGVAPQASSGSATAAGLYTDAANAATYEALQTAAGAGLAAGFDMIVDASFLSRARRTAMRELATRSGAHCVILDCRAPQDVLRDRIAKRSARASDASEATSEVLDHQLAHCDALSPEEQQITATVHTDTTVDYDRLLHDLRERRA